jgi:hypothetical protein
LRDGARGSVPGSEPAPPGSPFQVRLAAQVLRFRGSPEEMIWSSKGRPGPVRGGHYEPPEMNVPGLDVFALVHLESPQKDAEALIILIGHGGWHRPFLADSDT